MKKTIALLATLMATGVVAADFVIVYEVGTSNVVSYDTTYDLANRRILDDGSGFYIGTNLCGIATTTENPGGKTNLAQMAAAIVPVRDYAADWERAFDAKLKAAVTGLVKAYNAKIPAQYRPTAAEIKQAIGEELKKLEK